MYHSISFSSILPSRDGGGGAGGPLSPRRALRSALLSIGVQLGRSHCQLEDFLAHEDALKTGEITSTAMRHCLVLAGVSLTSPELSALDRSFRSTSRPEMIAWRDICRAAVEVCSKTDGISEGVRRLGDHQGGDSGGSVLPSPSRWKQEELLLKIDGEIRARNPNLEALFKTFDRSNHGTVTEGQFFSLLGQGLPRIHLTEDDTGTLARLFVDRTGCDFGGQVRYKNFMDAVRAQ